MKSKSKSKKRINKNKNLKKRNNKTSKKSRKKQTGGGLKDTFGGIFKAMENFITGKTYKDEEYSKIAKDYNRLLSM